MKVLLILSIFILSSCSALMRDYKSNQEKLADATSYWDHQYVTLAKFYEVRCGETKSLFDTWVKRNDFQKADQEIPSICSSVEGLGDHSGKCMPEQGNFTYKLKGVKGHNTRVDFIVAGNKCFADVHIVADINRKESTGRACQKGLSTECNIYLTKLENHNMKLVREIGQEADIYFKETGFRGRLFNFYHFKTTQNNFEKEKMYRSYSSSPF